MMTVVLSWCFVLAIVVCPFVVGFACEQKAQPAERGPGARLFHRY